MPFEEIFPGVYDITCLAAEGNNRYRAYLFDDDVPTLIDCARRDTTDALLTGIEETGLSPGRLIITHGDGDHVGGFDAVVDAYDVETWAPVESDFPSATPPTHRYQEGVQIGRFTTIHLPGHKDDNYGLIDEKAGIIIPGDAISGADQRGLPAGQFHLPPAVHTVNLNQAEETLEKILQYNFNSVLLFHGSNVLDGAHEKLDRYVNFPGKPPSSYKIGTPVFPK
tara:strand:- start:889 stop:1560 length:672 start_codon:yes stop_codon:yes gene_type:complete